MRPALVPGRWPGAARAAVGVLLALPTVTWPVVIIGYDPPDGIGVDVRVAGWLQIASAALLVVAIGFMLWLPVRAWLVPTLRRLTGHAPGAAGVPEVSRDGQSSHPIGPARMRAADDAGESSRPVVGPTVGFSDEGADGDRTGGSEPSG